MLYKLSTNPFWPYLELSWGFILKAFIKRTFWNSYLIGIFLYGIDLLPLIKGMWIQTNNCMFSWFYTLNYKGQKLKSDKKNKKNWMLNKNFDHKYVCVEPCNKWYKWCVIMSYPVRWKTCSRNSQLLILWEN